MLTCKRFLLLSLPLLFSGVVLAEAPKKVIRVVLLGDGTVCDYPPGSEKCGWGQMIGFGFEDNVRVRNFAGYTLSTKTVILEGVLKKAFEEKADYALIQFGHYDSLGRNFEGATSPFTDYKANLRKIIEACKQAGAQPILVTPMHRGRFNGDRLSEELKPYAFAMKAVGREGRIPVVDLYTSSGNLLESLGEEGITEIFSKRGDIETFSQRGARIMAALVLEGLKKSSPPLAQYIVPDPPADEQKSESEKQASPKSASR